MGTNLFQSCGRRSGREVMAKSMFEIEERGEYYRLEGQCEQNHEDVCRKVRKPQCLEKSLSRSTAGNRIKK